MSTCTTIRSTREIRTQLYQFEYLSTEMENQRGSLARVKNIQKEAIVHKMCHFHNQLVSLNLIRSSDISMRHQTLFKWRNL